MGDRVKICDKCNRLWFGGTPGIDEIDNLKNCGGHFIDTGIDFHEYLIIENISKDREFFERINREAFPSWERMSFDDIFKFARCMR